MKHRKRKDKKAKVTTGDPYWNIIVEYWDQIHDLYKEFEEKKPVMLFDIQEERIYAHPYLEFRADLEPESQRLLTKLYEEALPHGKLVVFVRDNEKKRLVSYTVKVETGQFP